MNSSNKVKSIDYKVIWNNEFVIINDKAFKQFDDKNNQLINLLFHSLTSDQEFNNSWINNPGRGRNSYKFIRNSSRGIIFRPLKNSGKEGRREDLRKRLQIKSTQVVNDFGELLLKEDYSLCLSTAIKTSDDTNLFMMTSNIVDFPLKTYVERILHPSDKEESYSSLWIDIYDEILNFVNSDSEEVVIKNASEVNEFDIYITKDISKMKKKIEDYLNETDSSLLEKRIKDNSDLIKVRNYISKFGLENLENEINYEHINDITYDSKYMIVDEIISHALKKCVC